SVDFGIWSGITIGNQVWADANSDGTFQSGTESGIDALTVQLLDSSNTVLQTTTTNSAGVYSFVTYQPGNYRIRIPTPPASLPLIAAINDPADNGEDNDSNALQAGGVGTVVTSPLIALTAGSEPGVIGTSNIENTLDFGFRTCPTISISPNALGAATQYSPYSVNLSATGGTGPYTWSLTSGTLPAGLTLTTSGVLSGTANASSLPGYYTFTVRSLDSATSCSATRTYTLTLLCPILTIAPSSLVGGVQYAAYSQALTAAGGTAPYAWSASPALPTGSVSWWLAENGPSDAFALNPAVAYNGLAYTTGAISRAFNFDGVDDVAEAADSTSLRPALITVEAWVNPATTGMPADGTVITKTTSNAGTDGFGLGQLGSSTTYGFWINDRTGNRITTTLTAGVWSHTAATYDGSNMRLYVNGVQVATKAYSTAISHSTEVLRIGNNGGGTAAWKGGVDEVLLYNRALSAAELLARYQATSTGNNGLPAGLALNAATGLLSGTPTSFPATYNFYARASDANGCPGVRAYALVIGCPVITITPTTLTAATQYAAYTAQTMTATGGTAAYTWTVFSGSLPTGMTLSAAGVLSGTPGSNPGSYNFTLQARDANNCTSTRAYTLTVNCPPITLSATTFVNAQQFSVYTPQTITAAGGNAPYSFSITAGALPSGMSMTSAGMVSGTPTAVPGTYSFTVRATDATSCVGTLAYSITVTCPLITITPSSVPAATQFAAYSQTLTASNGNTPYAWDISSGALPVGISLSAGGVISGTTAAAPGIYNFVARVTDAQSCTSTRSYALTVSCPAIAISPSSLPAGTATLAYSQTLAASGGTATYAWSLQSGTLPTGITLSAGGVLSGTTTQVGGFNFVTLATDANGCTGTRSYTLSISCPTIVISPASLPDATTATAYSEALSSTGGVGDSVWTLASGTLPTGLTLSSAGVLSGTPSGAPGSYSFTVRATDTNNCDATKAYLINLLCPTISVTTASLANGTTGSVYNATLAVSGGTAPHTWALTSGTLPLGLSLSPGGVISGLPSEAVTRTLTFTASDAYSCSGSRTLTLTTVCPALTLTPASLSSGYRGVAYSQTLGTTGGTAPYTYTLQTGTLPAGLSLTSAGVISGTPTTTGTASFSVRSADANGCSVTDSRSITISGLSLGDHVWNDVDQDGSLDVGELGISGVSLQLFATTNTVIGDADDISQGTTTTDSSGNYSFTGLAPGKYFVRITTPPAAQPYSSGIIVTSDNGVQDDNNGSQPAGKGAVVTSPVITLAVAREPGDFTGGSDNETSVDFAFRAVPTTTPLLEYDMNLTSNGLPAPPSYQNTCIVNSAKIQVEEDLNGLSDVSEPAYSGPIKGGARSRRVRDWDDAFDGAYSATRSSLTQNRDSLWVRFDMDPTATGNIGKLLMDVQRVNSASPVNGKAYLTWKEGSVYHTAVTDTFVIAAQPTWYSLDLNWTSFIGGATALPTGA
ncbi:MAG: putative Ig domain-containing protein, partial [Prosthecobacter sp.]